MKEQPAFATLPKEMWISPLALKGKVRGNIVGWFASMRPCPKCKRHLATNGKGVFRCTCGFSDRQSLPKAPRGRPRKERV